MNETDATLLELTPEEQTLFFEGLVMSDTTTLASYELVRCSRAASDGVRDAISIFGRYACMQRETASPNGQKSQ